MAIHQRLPNQINLSLSLKFASTQHPVVLVLVQSMAQFLHMPNPISSKAAADSEAVVLPVGAEEG